VQNKLEGIKPDQEVVVVKKTELNLSMLQKMY